MFSWKIKIDLHFLFFLGAESLAGHTDPLIPCYHDVAADDLTAQGTQSTLM